MKLKKIVLIVSIVLICNLITACNLRNMIGFYKGELIKIEPKENDEFYWSYYLYVPDSVKKDSKTYILVRTNNTGHTDDDMKVHDKSVKNRMKWRMIGWAEKLGTPVLIPVFPRYKKHWLIDPHSLDRDSLTTDIEKLERIDLQLIAMINDARARLKEENILAEEKILMCGFSASGMFTNRFVALHPQKVKAATIGSPGGWSILPINQWEGQRLRYPVGIGDLNELIGKEFDIESFKKIPLYFFVGDEDTNDAVPYDDAYGEENQKFVLDNFSKDIIERWKLAEGVYKEVGSNSKFVIYNGVGHSTTKEMKEDIVEFLSNNMK